MKTRILLIIISFVMICCSCKKDDNDPTGPGNTAPIIFNNNDLVGTWEGQVASESVTVTVNSSGSVEMSGGYCAVIDCYWTIDSSGRVTETGVGLFTENFQTWGQAWWDMQMSDDKKELDGSVLALFIGQRSVDLTKQ